MKPTNLVNAFSFALLSICLCASLAVGQYNRDRNTKKVREAAEQSARAARVFDQIMGTREKSIPKDLLDKAEAVAVFPGVLKGGLIVGGRGGSGVISRRVENGWSAPAFWRRAHWTPWRRTRRFWPGRVKASTAPCPA